MRVLYAKASKKDFHNLLKEIQKIAEEKLEVFGNNPYYPSLRVKKMVGLINIREGRITDKYPSPFILMAIFVSSKELERTIF